MSYTKNHSVASFEDSRLILCEIGARCCVSIGMVRSMFMGLHTL